MKHSKIIKDERGKVEIEITLIVFSNHTTDINGNKYLWSVYVYYTPPRKRKPCISNALDVVTNAEIQAVKLELWHKIKPTI